MKYLSWEKIRNVKDLSSHIGCSEEDLAQLSDPRVKRYNYREMRIPKKGVRKSDPYRVVYEVINPILKLIQKNLSTELCHLANFENYVQGFVLKRSIVSNARLHLGKRFLMKADIHHFFESISTKQVKDAFLSVGANESISELLAEICTHKDCLPQGASSSPVLANLVCKELDKCLEALSKEYESTYSRYADDITISGNGEIPPYNKVQDILLKSGFRLRDDRLQFQKWRKAICHRVDGI
jgi:hypothetical protein